MPGIVRGAGSIAGLLLVLTAFTFNKAPGLSRLAAALLDEPWALVSDVLKLCMTAILAMIAFGITRRRPSFYGMRCIVRQDMVMMFKTLAALFAVIVVVRALQGYPSPSLPQGGDSDGEQLPLVFGLLSAIVAGVTEEFVFRGYLIEELAELSGKRTLAAVVAVLAFGVAHVGSGYGWTFELMYPVLSGLALTILYLRTGNLWICALMHTSLDAVYALLHAA
jgi:membrane protease YdiL (CAAX protease family)